jgi:hypothetical protein
MGHIKKFNQHIEEGTSKPSSGSSDYLQNIKVIIKGDQAVAKLATKVVGDGKEPNQFFVTMSNDYMYKNDENELVYYSDSFINAPVKAEDHIETETFGPFEELKDAMKKVDNIDLSETTGPRMVIVEDRKTGQIYEKFLQAEKTIVWSDEINDDTKRYGY